MIKTQASRKNTTRTTSHELAEWLLAEENKPVIFSTGHAARDLVVLSVYPSDNGRIVYVDLGAS